jgi:hypothetical protein
VVEKVAPIHPEAVDVVNWDEMLTEYADDLSVSPKVINSPEQIAKIRERRAQEKQKAEAAQAATHTLPALTGAAKDLGAVDVGGGMNAVQSMLGGLGGLPGGAGAPAGGM